MKTKSIYFFTALLCLLGLNACSSDQITGESIFAEPEVPTTEFDLWLNRHYVEPYNVRFEYRMPDRETHFNYWVSPPPIDKSIEIAKLIKYTTLDAMVEMMSSDDPTQDPMLFVKNYFPKVLFLVGCFEIQNSGTTNLASAENGLQINILGVKFFDRKVDSDRIAGTMLHEFMHILDGTYAVPSEFNAVSGTDYIGNQYTTAPADYYQCGFVSNYARSSIPEDIAETGGRLITMTDEWWEATFAAAGAEGREKLERKKSILTTWLAESYGVDVAKWNEVYHRRMAQLENIDWTELDD